jgi:hypothetical protein
MYTPITKRVKVAQHKSSVAKLTEDEKKKTETAQTADKKGNLQNTTGTRNEGEDQVTASTERCGIEVPMSDPRCQEFSKMSQDQIEASERKQGLRKKGDPSADFESKPVMQEAQAASSIDLMGPQELRGNTRAGKIAARNVKKASKQYERMLKKFNKGKIKQEVLDAYKSELDNTVARSENIGQQATGMRNRYLTQRMAYDRGKNLKAAQEAGPVKAPEGTQTEEEFKSKFKKDLGINGSSSDPQTATTPTTSFTEMATMAFKPIKLGGDALFTGNLFDKGQKKSAAFKMKGYGSKK